jgi:hypothetical protein
LKESLRDAQSLTYLDLSNNPTLENCLEFDILSKKLEKLVLKYSKYLGERNQGADRRLPTASAILKKR